MEGPERIKVLGDGGGRGWNLGERFLEIVGPGPWRSWEMAVLGWGPTEWGHKGSGSLDWSPRGKGVPGMGSGWADPWVTAPALGASDFGVTQGPAQPPKLLLVWGSPQADPGGA